MTLNVKARDIAAFINTGTAGGLPSLYIAPQPEAVCDTAQTGDAATTINLYIFIADGTGNVCGSEITYAVTVDFAPAPPATIAHGERGRRAIYVSIPGTTDSDIKYWNVYTDPPPNGGPRADAGPLPIRDAAVPIADASGDDADSASDTGATTPIDLGDAATDADTDGGEVSGVADAAITCTAVPQIDGGSAAASSSTACPTSHDPRLRGRHDEHRRRGRNGDRRRQTVLVPDQYLGAQVGVSSTKATVSGLTNDTTYTVAVAGVDQVGNVGPLQLVTVCGAATTPDPTGNFWGTTTPTAGAPAGSARSKRSAPRPDRRRQDSSCSAPSPDWRDGRDGAARRRRGRDSFGKGRDRVRRRRVDRVGVGRRARRRHAGALDAQPRRRVAAAFRARVPGRTVLAAGRFRSGAARANALRRHLRQRRAGRDRRRARLAGAPHSAPRHDWPGLRDWLHDELGIDDVHAGKVRGAALGRDDERRHLPDVRSSRFCAPTCSFASCASRSCRT